MLTQMSPVSADHGGSVKVIKQAETEEPGMGAGGSGRVAGSPGPSDLGL